MQKTAAQELSKDFEKLSIKIIQLLFKDYFVDIKSTEYQKDGGYDALVRIYDEKHNAHHIYFECKLRSKTLNLRDISANLVIAYVEGAIALVVLTNTGYTKQLSQNFKAFNDKTFFNIKIVIGDEIAQFVYFHKIEISEKLNALLNKPITNVKTHDIFKLDLYQKDIYKQLFNNKNQNENQESNFIMEIFSDSFEQALCNLASNRILLLKSAKGTGKTAFANALVEKLKGKKIQITANIYPSQTQLLIEILFSICGVPFSSIAQEFSKETIDRIVNIVKRNFGNNGSFIANIVEDLLYPKRQTDVTSELYNITLCHFMIGLLKKHTEMKYVFHIEGYNFAPKEVQVFLLYFCKEMQENNITCILEEDLIEYEVQENYDPYFSNQMGILTVKEIELPFLNKDQSITFLNKTLPNFPHHIKKSIIKKTGNRLAYLAAAVSYSRNFYQENQSYSDLNQYLNNILIHNYANFMSRELGKYYMSSSKILDYIWLCNYRISFELSEIIFDKSEHQILQSLIQIGFLEFSNATLIVPSQISKYLLDEVINLNSYLFLINVNNLKKTIGSKLFSDFNYLDIAIRIELALNEQLHAIELLNKCIDHAMKHRHYSEVIEYIQVIKDNKSFLNAEEQLVILEKELKTREIQKDIASKDFYSLIQSYGQLIDNIPKEKQYVFQLKYDYFKCVYLFEKCNFHDSWMLTKRYYLQNEYLDTNDLNQFLAGINIIYVLSIKEIYGNEKAMKCFEKTIIEYPNSIEVKREYYSHIGCMNFYNDPYKSLEYFNKIILMLQRFSSEYYPLPFHEYVDRCMAAICSKQYNLTETYCEEAIKIMESNGVFNELGRLYNIKGCLEICKNNLEGAKIFFYEAVSLSDNYCYPLYDWRYKLNYAVLLSKLGILQESMSILNSAYLDFKDIYKDKLSKLSCQKDFKITREYFALMLFISTYHRNKSKETILSDFGLTHLMKQISEHVKQLTDGRYKNVYFKDCSYAVGKYLYMLA